jgi:hypothetical protein
MTYTEQWAFLVPQPLRLSENYAPVKDEIPLLEQNTSTIVEVMNIVSVTGDEKFVCKLYLLSI